VPLVTQEYLEPQVTQV
jgi:hypothetical protein